MVASGLAMAYGFDLIDIVFHGSKAPISPALRASLQHSIHELAAFALVVRHIGASLHHSVIFKDGLLSRMWFGQCRTQD
ncbi:hypothetical protein KX928_23830 [Roseobacter sp. YSTF-M11]|uniref:Uncharacterized protein n=1 Tax=Roseobacter insulae TaxID=2859783 RepID=A0A9X1G087_9RHOB|nr:hypothetical protein [Roseobacter insulae]